MRTWTLVSTSVGRARPAARHPCRDGHAAGQVSSHVRLDDDTRFGSGTPHTEVWATTLSCKLEKCCDVNLLYQSPVSRACYKAARGIRCQARLMERPRSIAARRAP